jgi:RecA-family ATPase
MSDLWDGPRMMATKADQITPTKPEWLWEQWLVAGALHVLVSRQGFGKSTLAAWLTGQVTTGRGYPDDPTVREPSNVATLSLEEAADRLVARLRATGADVGRVDILADVQDDDDGRTYRRPWRLPKDCSVLESFIRDGQIRLLIVDGLGYSITGDSHNYAVVGSALSALAGVAESTGCAVLGLTHPPKGGSDPVTAAIGSAAWTAIPRIVWVLGVDPEDKTEQRRVCRVSKTNYRQPDNGIGFSIDNDERFECRLEDVAALALVEHHGPNAIGSAPICPVCPGNLPALPWAMTNEERIRGVEDAVIVLTSLLEAKGGPFVRDVNPSVSGSGALIHLWMASVKAHRADEQA